MNDRLSVSSVGMAIDGAVSRLFRDLTSPRLPAVVEQNREHHRAIAKYRAARAQTLVIIRDLTQTQADFSPAAKVWSTGQNVEHLILTEKLYRAQMRKLIDLARKGGRHGVKRNIELTFGDIDNSLASIPRDVMPMLTVPLQAMNLFIPRAVRETMFRFPLIPALNPTASEPAGSQPIADLRSRAVSSLGDTEEIFRGKLPLNLMDMTVSHPVLGTNNVAHLLEILAAHEERHHLQIRKLLTNPGFPAPRWEEPSSAV